MTTINGISALLQTQQSQQSQQSQLPPRAASIAAGENPGSNFGPAFEITLSAEAVQAMESMGAQLSEKASKELDGLFNQIDKLFETAGDKPLSAEQEKQLQALEKKIDGILGPIEEGFAPFAGLSEKASKELDGLFNQIDKLFETVGDKPLSAEQEKQLEELSKKMSKIL